MSTISDTPASIGTLALPTSGTIVLEDNGVQYPDFSLTFTLAAARIPVTDGTTSGSYGALKIFDFVAGVVDYLACSQNYTAFAEGTALTTAAGDAAFNIGVGSAAIVAAADNTLATANKDIGSAIAITNSGGTGTGSGVNQSTKIVDGSVSHATLNLNWSGSAATIDASSTIDVTGVITVTGRFVS
jgi:hypothetical protein